jgi:hypothetical protein
MDKVRKDERRNWFYSYNMIFNLDISCHAKLIYMYLCRCADSEAQSFPSRNTIGKNCSISLTSVKNAMRELLKSRLLIKEEQFRSDGSQTSNLYTIFPEPYECESVNTESKTGTEIASDVIVDSDNNAESYIAHFDWEEAKYALPQLNNNPHAGQNTPLLRLKYDPLEVLPNLRTNYQEVNKNNGLKRKYKSANNTKLILKCDSS